MRQGAARRAPSRIVRPSRRAAASHRGKCTMRIVFNGLKFAQRDSEFTASLFETDGTCFGYWSKKKNGALLMDMQRKPIAFVGCDHCDIERAYVVTAGTDGRTGRPFYMYGLSDADAARLGLAGLPGYDVRASARTLLREIGI